MSNPTSHAETSRLTAVLCALCTDLRRLVQGRYTLRRQVLVDGAGIDPTCMRVSRM